MASSSLDQIKDSLLSVGYLQSRVRQDVPVPEAPDRKVSWVAYADQPFDARTSTIAVVDGNLFSEMDLHWLRPLGAPVIAQCFSDRVLLWKQTTIEVGIWENVPLRNIAGFFRQHQAELSPTAIYRAKVWSRMDKAWQLDFVDAGLLPLVEAEAGERLRLLLEQAVTDTKAHLGWKEDMSDEDGCWLLQAVFWLLAAKILQDKGVPKFVQLKLWDLDSVYNKLARHYNKHDPRPVEIKGKNRREALLAAAEMIGTFGHCGAVTTESLAWVYESALIDKATRQRLGTHSTPTWLVDEIVAKLRPWIEAMPVDDRWVFEPACGHAGFLISAMRLLSELLPPERAEERKQYLRKRLHGIEVDPFAYEVAKLSLTLADAPNDNGWMLEKTNMFSDGALRAAVKKANIVLANPPFENFEGVPPEGAMFSRADETFRNIVESLPVGGVFGIVMPQTILHSTQGRALRRTLLDEYEISEITLFADKVFNYGEAEIAVILGKRIGKAAQSGAVRYCRVRESDIKAYATTLIPTSEQEVTIADFEALEGSLFVPELSDIWNRLRGNPKLSDFVTGGKGFEHKGKDDPTLPKGVVRESGTEQKGLTKGFAGWNKNQLTHEQPEVVWLNLSADVLGPKRHGTSQGIPQILLNYARVSRGPWRLKALQDYDGHPVTSRFLVFRAKDPAIHIKSLWAICNSPAANAYAYSQSSKRDVLTGDLLETPVFALEKGNLSALEAAVDSYFAAAQGTLPLARSKVSARKRAASAGQLHLELSGSSEEDELPNDGAEEEEENRVLAQESLKYLHWRIDAEVLRFYNLPEEDERRILDLFNGEQRRGVPFVQTEYFPKGFTELNRLSDLLAITADWAKTNRRRSHLIKKDVKAQLSSLEKAELDRLEVLADAKMTLMSILHPSPPDQIQLTMERLKKEGRWIE